MRLILTRHGRTFENENNICQGYFEGKLNKEGKMQAKKLAKRLKPEKIDIVYCSPLKRTRDTAKEIMKYHKNTPIIYDKRIMERNQGKYEGKPFPKDWNWYKLPKGVETDAHLCKRVHGFLRSTYKKHKKDSVLVIAHGGVKMAFLVSIYDKKPKDFMKFEGIKNTSVSIFDIREKGKHKVHLLNCIKHLE
jgi:probable phosphoglycerate mutase